MRPLRHRSRATLAHGSIAPGSIAHGRSTRACTRARTWACTRATTVLLLASVLGLSACGGGGTGPPDAGGIVTIRLTADSRFSPADVTVDPGTTVRWVNDAVMLHTVTPDDPSQPGVWAAATTSTTGVVLTHTFSQAGQVYSYHCEPHLAAGMTGVVRVR